MMPRQIDVFNEIWDERPHMSEVSGQSLLPKGHPQWHWQFMHLLPKGSYSRFKFDKRNIRLALPEEHRVFDNDRGKIYDKFTDTVLDPDWNEIFADTQMLREEYYNV